MEVPEVEGFFFSESETSQSSYNSNSPRRYITSAFRQQATRYSTPGSTHIAFLFLIFTFEPP